MDPTDLGQLHDPSRPRTPSPVEHERTDQDSGLFAVQPGAASPQRLGYDVMNLASHPLNPHSAACGGRCCRGRLIAMSRICWLNAALTFLTKQFGAGL